MDLKSVRIKKHFTQEEASKICGVSLRTYKRFENDIEYKKKKQYDFFVNYLSNQKKNIIQNRYPKKLKIAIAGAGYVGLSTAILLCKNANVTVIDPNKAKITLINKNSYQDIIETSSFFNNKL